MVKMIKISECDPCGIRIADRAHFRYTPKILKNHIINRARNALIYIIKGKFRYFFDHREQFAEAGAFVYIPKDATYYYEIAEAVDAMQIEFDLSYTASGEDVVFSEKPLIVRDFSIPSVSRIFEEITYGDRSESFEFYSKMFLIFSRIENTENAVEPINTNSKIAPAVAYIQRNYKEKLYISKLAELCFLSESQIRRIFSATLGMSPIQYKNSILLRDACDMLNSGYISIGEIADSLGFDSIFAFSHFFKKETGVSPKDYKNSKYN